MIVITKNADGLCRRAFDKSVLYVAKPVDIFSDLLVDPSLSDVIKDCFIITDADVKSPKLKESFINSCANKHPNCKVVVICKTAKSDLMNVPGIDGCLVKPTVIALKEYVDTIVSSTSAKPEVVSAADSVIKPIDEFQPIPPMQFNPEQAEPVPDIVPISLDIPEPPVSDINNVPIPEPEEQLLQPNDIYAERIRKCESLGNIQDTIKELDAQRVVKDLIQQTASYAEVEDRLAALRNQILSIYSDPSNGGFAEAHKKARAFVANRTSATEESVTQLERCVSKMILDVTDRAVDIVNKEVERLDEAIQRVECTYSPGIEFSRLSGVLSAHSDIKLELATLMSELRSIFCKVDNIANSTASEIAVKTAKVTGSDLIDAHLKLRNEVISTPAIVDAIVSVITSSNQSNEKFVEADLKLKQLMTKLDKTLQLSDEVIEAQATILQYLTSHRIEDTVVAQTLIKKSLRIFLGNKGSGIHTIPYILSSMRSRQSANVLLCDLTGSSDFARYDCKVDNLDTFLESIIEKQFCVVSGSVESVEMTQRILTALYKYADYYRVINLILDTEQLDVFNAIVPDTLSVNYVIDASRDNLDEYKELIVNTRNDNVAQRIVLNMCHSDIVSACVDRLGIYDNFEVNVASVPYIREIVSSKHHGVDPALYDGITVHFKELVKCLS